MKFMDEFSSPTASPEELVAFYCTGLPGVRVGCGGTHQTARVSGGEAASASTTTSRKAHKSVESLETAGGATPAPTSAPLAEDEAGKRRRRTGLSRPFTWSNTVSSVDSVISFAEASSRGPEEVALKHLGASTSAGCTTDYRLLQTGWALADAVLVTGAILRAEPALRCVPTDPGITGAAAAALAAADERQPLGTEQVERASSPLQVVLSASCDFLARDFQPRCELVWGSSDGGARALVCTTPRTYARLQESGVLNTLPSHVRVKGIRGRDSCAKGADEQVDLVAMMAALRDEHGVERLDVSAGGVVIRDLIRLRLLDELRLTLAGQLCGPLSSGGLLRPSLFPAVDVDGDAAAAAAAADGPVATFGPESSPLLKYVGIRSIRQPGDDHASHLFLRCRMQYRH